MTTHTATYAGTAIASSQLLLAIPAVAMPLPNNNYTTNCNKFSEGTVEDQMDQEAQEVQVDQVDPTNQTQLPLNNLFNQQQM